MSIITFPIESNDIDIDKNKTNYCEKCNTLTRMQIKLRQCQHTICVKCALLYLKNFIEQNKVKIKCMDDGCKQRFHENDIRLLLDRNNNTLNIFLNQSERQYLLYKHDKEIIFYGLGGRELARQCPQCRNIFQRELGCNYVRCPNLRCNTWFCFECTAPFPGWQHFSQGKCKVSWDDIWKGTYLFRFLLTTNGLILFAISPIVFIFLICILPIFIAVSFSIVMLHRIYYSYLREAEDNASGDFSTIECFIYCIFLFPIFLLLGLFLGICSIFTGLLLFFFYITLMFLKCIPIIGQIDVILNLAAFIAGLFGLRNWRQILHDSKSKKRMQSVNLKQQELEESEKLTPTKLM